MQVKKWSESLCGCSFLLQVPVWREPAGESSQFSRLFSRPERHISSRSSTVTSLWLLLRDDCVARTTQREIPPFFKKMRLTLTAATHMGWRYYCFCVHECEVTTLISAELCIVTAFLSIFKMWFKGIDSINQWPLIQLERHWGFPHLQWRRAHNKYNYKDDIIKQIKNQILNTIIQ